MNETFAVLGDKPRSNLNFLTHFENTPGNLFVEDHEC